MFFFTKALKSPTVALETLQVGDVEVNDGVVRFKEQQFNLRDVMVVSINHATVPSDGIGGSALFKTREFESEHGVVQKTYRATFDKDAIGKIDEIAAQIEDAGGIVKKLSLRDENFRKAFF